MKERVRRKLLYIEGQSRAGKTSKEAFQCRLAGEKWMEERQVSISSWLWPVRVKKKQGWVTGNHSDISRDRKAGKVVGGGN